MKLFIRYLTWQHPGSRLWCALYAPSVNLRLFEFTQCLSSVGVGNPCKCIIYIGTCIPQRHLSQPKVSHTPPGLASKRHTAAHLYDAGMRRHAAHRPYLSFKHMPQVTTAPAAVAA